MALYTIKEETLTDIGDAIRAKLGIEETISPLDMPEAISSIETNGMNFDELVAQGVLTIDKTDEESGVVPFTNADQLGGIAAAEYALKTGTIANATMLGGKESKYYIQPYNLLDNSDFRNPVNQRGQTTYTKAEYCIDRWIIYGLEASNSLEMNVSNGCIILGENTYLQQRYPIGLYDTNKTYTIAIWYLDGGKSISQINIGRLDGAFDYVNIFPEANRGVVSLALYEGQYTAETLPPYVPKGYAVELAECMRYAYLIGAESWLTGIHITGHGLILPLELPMRAVPTATGTYKAFVGNVGWVDITLNSIGYNHQTGKVHNLVFEPPAELTANNSCIITGINGLFADL